MREKVGKIGEDGLPGAYGASERDRDRITLHDQVHRRDGSHTLAGKRQHWKCVSPAQVPLRLHRGEGNSRVEGAGAG